MGIFGWLFILIFMIYAFTGKTGSGKTFQMVKTAYAYWKEGVDVYSNTILFFEKYTPKKWIFFGEKIKTGKIIYFENITDILEANNAIVLFDEAQVLFNARLWEALPAEFQYKLQQHRKHKLDLFCTTQNMKAIDITYRRLVQYWFHCEDLFAFLGKRNPSIFTVHRRKEKDIDELYNDVDDLKVPDIATKIFIIHKLKRRLYDTLYDIGFKRFKTIWLSSISIKEGKDETQDTTNQLSHTSQWMIVPKEMSLSDARKVIQSLKFPLSPIKSQNFKRT